MAKTRTRDVAGTTEVVPWTADLALRAARVDTAAPRERQVARIRDAIDAGQLPPVAVDALIAAGWRELSS